MKRNRVYHTVRSPLVSAPVRFAVAADLHGEAFDDVMEDFRACDAILVPGDLINRHRETWMEGPRFLQEAPKAAPVFYSIGNHERRCAYREAWMKLVKESRVTLLDNESVLFKGIRIGGLSSMAEGRADDAFLDRFEREKEFRLLMCHHPEVWRDHVQGRRIDLTLCGHAHGGQIQLFGKGLYAPGQGFFPKLTHGVHGNGTMLISRGMSNGTRVPRINNPCELIILTIEPEKED